MDPAGTAKFGFQKPMIQSCDHNIVPQQDGVPQEKSQLPCQAGERAAGAAAAAAMVGCSMLGGWLDGTRAVGTRRPQGVSISVISGACAVLSRGKRRLLEDR